jgi:cytochrome c-type biogenesis protein
MFIDPSAVTIPLALMAGLFSFVSPCVLPLVPAYIGYLTGQAANTMSTNLAVAGAGDSEGSLTVVSPARWLIFLHGTFFVLGFSAIFIFLGLTAGAIGSLRLTFVRNSNIISILGGLLIIVLALHIMGVIRIPFLYYDTRNQQKPKHEFGLFGSFLMGVTFSAGWSPCVGPFLAAMFTLGASTASIGQAVVLLAFYSLGLGIPFLLTALLLERATGPLKLLNRHMKTIEIISGILLIIVGLLVMTGSITRFSAAFASGTDLTIMLDEWLVRLAGGE